VGARVSVVEVYRFALRRYIHYIHEEHESKRSKVLGPLVDCVALSILGSFLVCCGGRKYTSDMLVAYAKAVAPKPKVKIGCNYGGQYDRKIHGVCQEHTEWCSKQTVGLLINNKEALSC
jgi:hypothetical protein